MEAEPSYRPKIFYSQGPLRGLEEPFPASDRIDGCNLSSSNSFVST